MVADRRFSAHGRKAHICKACEKLPREQRVQRQVADELADLVKQSNLSAANIMRLRVLAKSPDESVRTRARALLEVAKVHPHRSRRVEWLRDKMPELFAIFAAAFPAHVAENDEDALFAARADDDADDALFGEDEADFDDDDADDADDDGDEDDDDDADDGDEDEDDDADDDGDEDGEHGDDDDGDDDDEDADEGDERSDAKVRHPGEHGAVEDDDSRARRRRPDERAARPDRGSRARGETTA